MDGSRKSVEIDEVSTGGVAATVGPCKEISPT